MIRALFFLSVLNGLFATTPADDSLMATLQGDPSSLIEGKINALTGDPCVFEEDLVIQGAEPIRLTRAYLPGAKPTTEICSWFSGIFGRAYALSDHRWIVMEKNGCPVIYKKAKEFKVGKEKYFRFEPSNLNKGFSNTSMGPMSSRTNYKNNYVIFDEKFKFLTLHSADGSIRNYKKVHKGEGAFRLLSEQLTNGNWILYDYEELKEDKFRLKTIRTTNPAQNKTYARADFHHMDPKGRREDLRIVGSDGQTLEYRFETDSKGHQTGSMLSAVSSQGPDRLMGYAKFKNEYEKGDGSTEYRLGTLSFPLDRKFQIDYYHKFKEKVAGQTIKMVDAIDSHHYDPRRSRVKTISSPSGPEGQFQVTHSFIYDVQNHKTSVYDVEGNRTDYFGASYLWKIERYSKEGKLLNAERFYWIDEKLDTKTFIDSNENPLFSRRYIYDGRGNIIEERFYGNLSGHGTPPVLDSYDRPKEGSSEVYSKHFKYSDGEPNLLLEEWDDAGKRIAYEYLPGTDLPTAQLVFDQGTIRLRRFYEYDGNNLLTSEINDDGIGMDKNDLTGVSVRTIRQIIPVSSGPYIGLPEIVEESYLENGQQRSLGKIVFHYTTGARIAQKDVYDAEGELRYSLKTRYDEKGRPVERTNALFQVETIAYDLCGNPIVTKDFSGRTSLSMEYDLSNRLTYSRKEGDDGVVAEVKFGYDAKQRLASETDNFGHATLHFYDALDHDVETLFPKIPTEEGVVVPITRQSHDSAGNEILKIDAEGNSTKTSYNAYGKPACVIYADGAKEEYTYALDGTLKMHIDPAGVIITYITDYLNRVVHKTISLNNAVHAEESFEYIGYHLVAKTDAEGNRAVYTYDGAGRKTAEEFAGEKILFSYDALGRPHKVTKGDLCSITEYDLLDRVIEERQASLSGEVLRKVRYEYDSASNRIAIYRNVEGLEACENLLYDSNGRLIQKTDPIGNIETTTYNDAFIDEHELKVLQKTHADALGLKTIETFNTHRQSAKVELWKGKMLSLEEKVRTKTGLVSLQIDTIFAPDGTSRKVHSRWRYDSRGRLSILTEADNTIDARTTRYAYTPVGELAARTKPDDTTLRYQYDGLGNLVLLSSSDGTVNHSMTYDRLGRLVQSDGRERTVDARGRTMSEAFAGGLSLANRYDLMGRRFDCRIPAANCTIEYGYNALDLKRVERKTLDGATLYSHDYIFHDLSGNLLEESLIGNLGHISYSFDPLSRKKSIDAPLFTQEVLEWDPVGNIRKIRTQNEVVAYSYDDLYQLTAETGFVAHDYLYDSIYNRLKKDSETYDINALQEVVSHFVYDKNGNPISQGDTRHVFDALDRLIRIEAPNLIQTFTYDSQHRCLSKTTLRDEVQETRYFLYDGKNEIGSFDESGAPVELRVLGSSPHAEIGAAIAIELQGKAYAPIHDLQGNVAALLSIEGTQPTFYRYSAFGEEQIDGVSLNPWRFSSKRTDAETSLVNYGRRYYLPAFGRWLTPDPEGFTDGMNLYAFVQNDPLTHLDEYGLMTFDYKRGWVNCPWGSQYSWSTPQYGSSPPLKDLRLLPSINLQPKFSPHYYVNGILNTHSDNRQGARSLLKTFAGRANIIPFYSESFGALRDLLSVYKSKADINYTSFAIRKLSRELRSDGLSMEALQDPRKVFVTCFSRGSTDVWHA
ncbi:MAG: RHS repeat-associated core domain-containing protein, partial [Verrucomicrobiota bacterium]|nr:RHS repeat-associated core domain-containing protein [Verrucomicrobiota bacterium]